MSFNDILSRYRETSFSERDKGTRFERLMRVYLLTDPKYTTVFKNVWLWEDFFARELGINTQSDTNRELVYKYI